MEQDTGKLLDYSLGVSYAFFNLGVALDEDRKKDVQLLRESSGEPGQMFEWKGRYIQVVGSFLDLSPLD